MRYRRLSSTGDYTFGQGSANFYIDDADVVRQHILTTLQLLTGQWFLDLTAGVPYVPDVIGAHTQATRDEAIREAILGVDGVTGISTYSSNVNQARQFSIAASVDTIYGQVTVETTL